MNLVLTPGDNKLSLVVNNTATKYDLTVTDETAQYNLVISPTLNIASGYIPNSIITAKGDLLVGSAASTPATLSSTAYNGYFPQVDTSESKGYRFTNQIDGGVF